MTDTKDVAYIREKLCMASDVFNDVFVKAKEISEENTKLKELLKECKLAIFDYPPYDLASDKIRLQIKIDKVLGKE